MNFSIAVIPDEAMDIIASCNVCLLFIVLDTRQYSFAIENLVLEFGTRSNASRFVACVSNHAVL